MCTVSLTSIIWAILDKSFPLSYFAMQSLATKILSNKLILTGLLHLGLLCTAWTSFAEQKAMQYISASETTLIYTLEPLTATAFGCIFLKEKFTLTTAIGALFIVAGGLKSTLKSLNIIDFFRNKNYNYIFTTQKMIIQKLFDTDLNFDLVCCRQLIKRRL